MGSAISLFGVCGGESRWCCSGAGLRLLRVGVPLSCSERSMCGSTVMGVYPIAADAVSGARVLSQGLSGVAWGTVTGRAQPMPSSARAAS